MPIHHHVQIERKKRVSILFIFTETLLHTFGTFFIMCCTKHHLLLFYSPFFCFCHSIFLFACFVLLLFGCSVFSCSVAPQCIVNFPNKQQSTIQFENFAWNFVFKAFSIYLAIKYFPGQLYLD